MVWFSHLSHELCVTLSFQDVSCGSNEVALGRYLEEHCAENTEAQGWGTSSVGGVVTTRAWGSELDLSTHIKSLSRWHTLMQVLESGVETGVPLELPSQSTLLNR